MPRPRWSPVYLYLAVFGAVVAWGVTRHPPLHRPAEAGAVVTSPHMTHGAGHLDVRRIVQRMVLR